MSLTVITPILNEETFLPLYLESVVQYADEIIIVDGGSVDRSLYWIRKYQKRYNIKLFYMKQTGIPYSDEWDESKVRNFLIEQATGDWIANIDADEIFDDRISAALPDIMKQRNIHVYQFPFINFWRDPGIVRVNAPHDERWSNDIVRMWRNGMGIRYNDQKHHCTLQAVEGGSFWRIPRSRAEVPLYHYHYALGRLIKFNDNRRGDVNMLNNRGNPDWEYQHGQYEIRTKPFLGRHPSVVQAYLKKRVKH